MPDRYGFNQLGDTVRCIDCPAGGPIWQWPEPKRWQHARRHRIAAKPPTTDLRRHGSLLAQPPTTSDEEKEATMATSTKKGEPAKRVAIDILRKAGEPLHANEIAKRVLASGRCVGLKGKTPKATISAMLAVGSKPGGPFTRVDKGTYTLADAASAARNPAQTKPAASKRTTTRKPPLAAKSKRSAKRATGKRTAAKRAR